MSCQTCTSTHSRLPILCPTCARNRLYQLRLEYTQILLEKEALGQHIESAVSSDRSRTPRSKIETGSSEADHDGSRRWVHQTISSRENSSASRLETVRQHTKTLKEEIEARKADILERRRRLARRRSDSESAHYQLGEREAAILISIQNTTKRTEHLWHTLHSKTAEARIFLCREVAHLYGLRLKTARKADARQNYVLGGLAILDLLDMNGKLTIFYIFIYSGSTPAHISTSLSNIAHLLVLVSHYLSLRLPAEIILPHRNYPNPTIFTPAASYNSSEATGGIRIPRPSSALAVHRSLDTHAQPRPRPLFIDKALPRLAKEDPATYSLFLEGATLLAWDVAWLCRTQGINRVFDKWEDVCDIGKNMFTLLIAPPAPASNLMRAFAGRDTQAKIKPTKDTPQTTINRTKSFPMLGHYSHGTVHSFLAASEGSDFMRTWKLATPTKIADQLKASLLGEMASAEWELLEEQEWDDGTPKTDQQPSAQGSSTPNSSKPSDLKEEQPPNQPSNTVRLEKGKSGWTKLHSR
ncbi:hypothetical protein N7478_002575 [Penicillium angulare]|uniref:uncharacterized protein n=1 Tax=Penicillium angulare TaxID=116970 RepID=UPI002540FC6D|nr:uncharacterized protein N7478_002575 [Penicillium angulare]KAJ5286889.1 hypothetical protein N7478_002575 [Penicillium angulare]